MKQLADIKVLIVEDEEENRDLLLRLLLDEYEIDNESINEAENLVQAKEAIEEFVPNIILLDLNIPADQGHEPNITNAYEVLEKTELYNSRQANPKDKIKTIVISGSIEEKGVQKFISQNKEAVFDFIDKSVIAANPEKFKVDFAKKLERALNFIGHSARIEYSFVRRSLLKGLEMVNPDLWNKIDSDILKEFERLNDKNVNEFTTSKGIIASCGEIVEDIIILLEESDTELPDSYSDNDKSVLRRLTALSGRKYCGRDEDTNESLYEEKGSPIITRISLEYAILAYRMRSQALHSKEGDHNLNKWYAGHKFNKEDASVALNLIIPLILDYISNMK